MSRKLTKDRYSKKEQKLANNPTPSIGQALTQDGKDRQNSKFEISIRESLDSKYSFSKLKPEGIKEFHKFIEGTVGKGLTWKQVTSNKLRTRGVFREEKVNGSMRRVSHYTMGSGRIFGYREGNDFIIYRIDPNHDYD